MGLLRTLVTLPASAPLKGVAWLGGKITEAAEAELRDPAAIRRALRALEVELEAGRMDEETFEAQEMILLRRLSGARDA